MIMKEVNTGLGSVNCGHFSWDKIHLFYYIQVGYSGQLDTVARKGWPKVATISEVHCIFLNSHFPNIISAILSFSKLIPENPRIHAVSRNSKNIQGFVNTLDILESS